ncbi:MAG: hypothetical protein JO129_02655 [Candidatus Dependentiae bacterium]|nr:hypothetical protein [Candidatus Dependentiae bacterium]
MNLKNNIHNIIRLIFTSIIITASSLYPSGGSFLVYNNSYYTVNFIVTTQSGNQAPQYVQAKIASAPINADGTLTVHPTDSNYVAGSNVPMGTVSNVVFANPAQDFNIQILDASGNVIKQINVGSSLGTVVNSDAARAVYIYSNLNNSGIITPAIGGAVFYWDATHPLNNPAVQAFPATASA